jgi:hypothetical protein
MFLVNNKARFLSEAATADMIDPEVSPEVKDTIEDLEDAVENVEPVEAPETTNGGIPDVTVESAPLYSHRRGYYVTLGNVMRLSEAAAAEEDPDAAASEPDGEASAEDSADQACNVVEKIADQNGVDASDVTVVISADEAARIAEMALSDAKAGKKKGPAKKKLDQLNKTIDNLKKGGVKLAKDAKKKLPFGKKKK